MIQFSRSCLYGVICSKPALFICLVQVDLTNGYIINDSSLLPGQFKVRLHEGRKQNKTFYLNHIHKERLFQIKIYLVFMQIFGHRLWLFKQIQATIKHIDQIEILGNASTCVQAAQFHFHWAAPNAAGSEHLFNGNQYWGELHIVHYNTKYPDLGTAASEPDGLAVLGFFMAVSMVYNSI